MTAEIEGYIIDCLVAMVMKLSEVTFRSLFFKVPVWFVRLPAVVDIRCGRDS